MTDMLLALAGLLAGIIDSIAGGGGLITVPALSVVMGPGVSAIGTNKIAAVAATLVALFVYLKNGHVQWKKTWPFALTVGLSSMLGALLSPHFPPAAFKWVLLICSPGLLFIVWRKDFWIQHSPRAPHAPSLRAYFVFNMANSFFASPEFSLQPHLSGTENLNLPDMTLPEEVPVQVRGIQAQINYQFRSEGPQVFLGSEQVFVSQSLQADVLIQDVAVNSVRQENVGGAEVTVHVQAECKNVHLRLNAKLAQIVAVLKIGVSKDGQLELSLPYIEAMWPENVWIADPLVCSGAKGFQDRVQTGLNNFLKDPRSFTIP